MQNTNKTKKKILHLIKINGRMSQFQIADELGLTKMAISRQLGVLRDEELLKTQEEKQKVGRPITMYELTESAMSHFPNEHSTLSVSLIESIRECAGEDTLNNVLNHRLEAQIIEYQRKINISDSLESKLEKLTELRAKEGYMPTLNKLNDNKFEFIENNCPISTAAKSCSGICEGELSMLNKVLGDNVEIDRKEHLIDKQFRCFYLISENNNI